jgi:acyl carrier protein
MLDAGVTTREGIALLERLLSSGEPRTFVSTGSLEAWRARVDAIGAPAPRTSEATQKLAARTGAATAPVASSDIESRLAAMWSELLGIDAIGPNDNFFEVGGHSLLAVRLTSRIAKAFRCSIPLTVVFAEGTIESLAAHIRTALSGADTAKDGATEDEFALTAVPRERLQLDRGSLDKTRTR